MIVNPKMRRVVTKAPLKNAEMTLPNSCERNKRAQLIIFVCVVPHFQGERTTECVSHGLLFRWCWM